MRLPSGDQVVLVQGDQRAVVTEAGATLRCYDVAGVPVLWGFGSEEQCSAGRGQVLVPWPNRLEDGRYRFAGEEIEVPLDEPGCGTAIHGLVRWLSWRVDESGPSSCRLSCVLNSQPAYPFTLVLSLSYRLGNTGLAVDLEAINDGDRSLPFAAGFHPYLDPGPGGLDRARLALPVSPHLVLDGRGLPVGSEPAAEAACSALARPGGSYLGGLVLDDCFTGVETGSTATWCARLEAERDVAPCVGLWADAAFSHVMCFTGDTLGPEARRRAVAIEPMTAPPNALHSGMGVIELEPGQRFGASWGIDPFIR